MDRDNMDITGGIIGGIIDATVLDSIDVFVSTRSVLRSTSPADDPTDHARICE